jgi:hypothetical protein
MMIRLMATRVTPKMDAKSVWVWPPWAYISRMDLATSALNFGRYMDMGERWPPGCVPWPQRSLEFWPGDPRYKWLPATQKLSPQLWSTQEVGGRLFLTIHTAREAGMDLEMDG